MTQISLGPQEGPQEMFLKNDADICIYGGSAGGGKTFSLLLDFLRHFNNKDAGAVCFRRTSPQVRNEGGLWDTSKKIYGLLGAEPKESVLTWKFPSGCKLKFGHLEYEKNVLDWQGSQIPIIYFDELTHFTEKQFWYMLSRNRSISSVKPYIRATTNPSSKSWVRKLVDWYLLPNGKPDLQKSGIKRYFIRVDDKIIWSECFNSLKKEYPASIPKSFTFIPANLNDNQILMKQDPSYLANLQALSKFERMQLLDGNWNVEEAAGIFFKKHYFTEVNAAPKLVSTVRCWDRAATEFREGDKGDPDYTVGLKLGVDEDGIFYILDIIRERVSALKVEKLILNTAKQDGVNCVVKGFQDPGGAGKNEIENFIRMLSGFIVVYEKITTDKITACKSVSAQSEAGNIKILKSCRNKEEFYFETENFPQVKHDDIIDALSGAFNYLAFKRVDEFTDEFVPNDITTTSHLNNW